MSKPTLIKDSLTKTVRADTTKKTNASAKMVAKDSVVVTTDTLKLATSTDSLDAPVTYEALDSGVLDIPNSQFLLYGKAHVVYNTLDLKAATIELDNQKNLARAYYTRDSTGKVLDRPVLVDGDMTSESDSMFYNFKSQRGVTKSTYTKQGEMFVYAEKIKKVDAQSFFASNGRFTTCNLDTPHFAFRARKMKLVNNKWAYSGLAYPEFENVPMPIGLPFGIYPLSQGRHSGLLAPQFAATENFGLGLEGLGYYKVLNEHFDATLRTNIYSYGGFAINFSPTYRVRYKYNGGLRLSYQNTRINFKGDPDFQTAKTFNFSWNHSMDSKARPGTMFSANINFGSVKYNQFVANSPQLNFTNQMQSSIQYSKTWGQGKYNLSVTGNHTQNNNTGQFNVNLPNVNMTVNTFYPFKPRLAAGEAKWYEKLGIGYNGQLLNQFSFFANDTPRYDLRRILDTMQWGAQHIIPINLALPAAGPVTISPQFSFTERWYGQRILKTWSNAEKRLDTTISRGLYAAREISFGVGLQTAIFGTLNFGKNSNIKAIRHVIRPIVSASYRPDLQQRFYYKTQVDTTGRKELLSVFEGSLFNAFSPGRFGGLNFGLQNNLEMKVRDKSDSSNPNATKKIKLIDIFSVTTAYNFLKDTQQLDPFNILLSTTILEKINITGSTILNPYLLDSTGRNTNYYAWQGKNFSLGTFTNGSLSIGAAFQSKPKDKGKTEKENELEESSAVMTPDEQMRQQEYIRNNPAEFADFNVPWSLNVAYALSFTKVMKPDFSGFRTQTFSNLTLNGDFSISPKWKMGGAMFYDLKTQKIGNLNLFLSRELHCWQLAINIVPIGLFRSFNVSISPRAALLRDLKVNRSRFFYE